MSSTIRIFLSLGLLTILLLVSSCSSTHYIAPASPPVKASKKSKSHPTQRPYEINNKTYYPVASSNGFQETGMASWYGRAFHGKKTSNGERFDMYAKSAAHKTLPMGTVLLVQHLGSGKETVVRVNDRGPFVAHRIIDLSYAAAVELNMDKEGTAKVHIVALTEEQAEGGQMAAKPQETQRYQARRATGDQYYIQVGAFTDKENARQLAHKIADTGQRAYLRYDPEQHIIYYRVLVNGGRSLQQARSLLPVLSRSGFPKGFVIAGSD